MDKAIEDNCDLYLNEQSSDAIVVIGDNRIPVHKSVLICLSDYFKAMFSIEMIESNLNEVRLEEKQFVNQFLFVLRIVYGFKVTEKDLNDLTFNELFDSIIIANKYDFKKVEIIISDLFMDKLNCHSTDVFYVKRSCNSSKTTTDEEISNKENLNKYSNIFEVLDISKSYNLNYFSYLCEKYIERKSSQQLNSYKYYFNLWC